MAAIRKNTIGFCTVIFVFIFVSVLFSGCGESADPNALPTYYPYSAGEGFLSNIRSDGKSQERYIKCNIVITTSVEAEVLLLTENSHVVRDSIYSIFRALTMDDLKREDLQTYLSDVIIDRLNSELPLQGLHKVYFNDLITQ